MYKFGKVLAAVAAASFASLFSFGLTSALAACAIAEGQGFGQSQGEAGFRARQDATFKAYQGGAAADAPIQFSQPACFFLDDGTNTVSCQVQASWCTTPVVAPQPPRKIKPIFRIKPHLPRYHKSCRKFTAEAADYTIANAQALVYHTLDSALRNRTGRSLQSRGVRAHQPHCYRLGGQYARAGIIQCRMTAQVCGW